MGISVPGPAAPWYACSTPNCAQHLPSGRRTGGLPMTDPVCGAEHAPQEDRPVSATAGSAAGQHGLADKLGIASGAVVQEIGWDDDCDEDLRKTIVERSGQELVDEDYDDVVDVVMLWWRDDDGDLVDTLVDALGPLTDHGVIWLLTPKAARPGHVEPSDVSEAAPTAGLQQTSSISAGRDWNGARLVAPKASRGKGR